jgi:hypothetical protein
VRQLTAANYQSSAQRGAVAADSMHATELVVLDVVCSVKHRNHSADAVQQGLFRACLNPSLPTERAVAVRVAET